MSIKYKWLSGRLREMINAYIEIGVTRLPTEAELCSRFRVSRQTVRQALSLLEQEGLIEKKQGSGSYITGLRSNDTGNTIAILLPSDSDYIYPGLQNDLQQTLSARGFSSRIYVTDNRVYTEREILQQLLALPPRGIIAEGCQSAFPNPNGDLWHELTAKGCPVLFLHNNYPALGDCLYIKDDNTAGSRLLAGHLLDKGHTHIGGIFRADDQQGLERYQGFTEAMRSRLLPVPDERIDWFDSSDLRQLMKTQDSSFLKKIVQESLPSCTAVICYNDLIAYHLISELKLAGYELPADMAVAAFDNSYLSSSRPVTITTLAHQPHEMGSAAARMMIEMLKGRPVTKQLLPWKLIERESTAALL